MGVAVYQQPEREHDTPVVGGHGRGTSSEKRPPEPRVPIIGLDSGAIPGTKPQPGCSGAYLERAGRDIVRSRLHRNRFKAS